MFWKRVLTVLVTLPILLYIIIAMPPQVTFVFFWASCMLVTFEFSKMFYFPLVNKLCDGKEKPHSHSRFFVVVLCALYFFLVTQLDFPMVSLLLLLIFLDIFVHFSIKSSPEFIVAHVLFAFVAIGYCCLPWILLWDIYEKAPHGKMLWLLLVIVMANDIGAYLLGSRFGQHKFAPRLSPKKTWEGFLGGLTCGVLGALIYNYFVQVLPGDWLILVLCGLGCSMMAAVGDLVESSFKRFSRVKDSGNIFPGHGGLLDRVDAIVFTVPFFHFIIYWL